ncbi:MAG: sulfatase-like hydrolase/transferase [Fimbriimonadaceae bacterium]|nr:sulfatase-like hydrolase/transferase [Fimbriimonadaceae bacterium]
MPSPPHVLVICCDHWPGELLGCAGHANVLTPTLDQLARNGRRYPRAYSECPICIPARRTLMTGLSPRSHGDRVYRDQVLLPEVTTLPQAFRNAGYQATAVGKLHVWPQRARIGFDEVILHEEGRMQFGVMDDYELFLAEQGHPGEMFGHGMGNNEYHHRAWHLPEACHVTTWTTRQMCRAIQRRDPTRPGFWYLSYCHPHPPLAPLAAYLELYRDRPIDAPYHGAWSSDRAALPWLLQASQPEAHPARDLDIAAARRAFYALCTQIDHQLRLVLGTLREEGLLDQTIIAFTSDHGDLLGNHGLWGKSRFYEGSAQVPLLLVGPAGDPRVGHHEVDPRLAAWVDLMPTLLDLAGLPVPDHCEGLSLVGEPRRELLYGEHGEGPRATRMVHDGRWKLIYYPVGNRRQLFDLDSDPRELLDRSSDPACAQRLATLELALVAQLYGGDEAWAADGRLIGLPDRAFTAGPNRTLSGQRGLHQPPPIGPSGQRAAPK